MSTLSLRIPESIYQRIKEFAQKDGISINQFIASALSEKISAFATKDYLELRASRADQKKYSEALSKIPDTESEAFDRL
ncbi:MAG: BrnA antitoxin family protein [Candidatus Marinimicrobia bacterium]|jgi:uncharacterized protein (DUF1778 family)|nr:BrnA antitoxin family protein [Candidatus Neomarinimicrobiota bacterium]